MFKIFTLNNNKDIDVAKNGKNFLTLRSQSPGVQSASIQLSKVQASRVQASNAQASRHPESKCPESKGPGILSLSDQSTSVKAS